MNISRRHFLGFSALALSGLASRFVQAATSLQTSSSDLSGNFRYIYGNPVNRKEFRDFLTNVFHLYPEDKLHTLIEATSNRFDSDGDIYQQLQNSISDIKPLLADLTYAVPALIKQKRVMAEQTKALLPEKRFDGYLELGSTGRYLDSLEEVLDIKGDIFYISERPATYSIPDIIDRGQLSKQGSWLSLGDYQPDIASTIPAGSLDLVTVYIGFHHCPPAQREAFIGSIRDTLKPGGSLILRDHDAHDEKMWKLVALAHDVFNMGTLESWDYNDRERRHFYPLAELDSMMTQFGFKSRGEHLRQTGDPTLNTLMLYQKA
jgi:SAM-dependent methyltransferase